MYLGLILLTDILCHKAATIFIPCPSLSFQLSHFLTRQVSRYGTWTAVFCVLNSFVRCKYCNIDCRIIYFEDLAKNRFNCICSGTTQLNYTFHTVTCKPKVSYKMKFDKIEALANIHTCWTWFVRETTKIVKLSHAAA
jgi:hypothetical protein